MASRKLTGHRPISNAHGATAERPSTESTPNHGANWQSLGAYPAKVGAPFFVGESDSPANGQVKGPGHGPAARGGAVNGKPDRPNAVAVLVGGARPRTLDTTAQLSQSPAQDPAEPAGEGGGLGARDTLRKRARAKGLSQALSEGLAGLGELTPLRHSYLATLACAATLRQEGGVVAGKYCGNRWCVVCNRIRTAKLWRTYAPELAGWADAQFVTLTLPNVKGSALHGEVRRLLKALTAVKRGVRRTDGLTFRAVRKLEVTFNVHRWDYHPHLHLVVDGSAAADALVRRWLAMNTDASPKAQDVRPATNPAELFKYVTKLCTKIEGKHTTPPPLVLDTIFKALRGLRAIQAMGFKVSADAEAMTDADGTLALDASTPAPALATERTDWEWLGGAVQDWVNLSTGEVLADHTPTPAHLRLLANVRDSATRPGDDGGGG